MLAVLGWLITVHTGLPARAAGESIPGPCSTGSLCVGPHMAYPSLTAALATARNGDTIEIVAGTYRESVDIERRDVVVRGVGGRPRMDCAGLPLAHDKACILISADGVTLDNLEIHGAVIPQRLGENGACVRNERGAGFRLRRIFCHDSQDGVLTSGADIIVEDSTFDGNGWTGQTHNAYFNDCGSVTVRGSTFSNARVGHEFKSRCARTIIDNSTFFNTKGSRDLDIPDGGETVIENSILVKFATAESEQIIGFGAESCHRPASMLLKGVRVINLKPGAEIQNFDKCRTQRIELDGVSFEGFPVSLIGAIVHRTN
jgi:hypothetical protein